MERGLFEQLTLSSRGRRRRGVRSLPVSLAIHAAALAAIVIGPLMAPNDLPGPTRLSMVLAAPPVLAPVPPPPRGAPPRVAESRPPAPATPALPSVALVPPSWVDSILPEAATGDEVGMPACEGCVPWGLDDVPLAATVAPTAPAPTPPAVRPGGDIDPPVKLHHVAPSYPDLAKQAGVEGVVIIECRIDTEGRVADARVLRGHPLLDEAALAAVREWRYRATLLNGEPVPVIMTVTVRFTLRR